MTRRTASVPTPTRAVVTGGAGFVGSHLVDRLRGEGLAVLAIDDFSSGTPDNLPDDAPIERMDIVTGDLDGTLQAWRPDVVFHLAAQASVVRSQQDPDRDLAVNVAGTYRVAAAARRSGARRLVFVSSGGAVYGETRRPATERSLPAPGSYYGVHKLAAEGHVRLAGISSAIARPSNIYGPRQRAGLEGAVVAAFVDQARDGVLTIHGDGSQTRDFVHVLDVVEALWRLAQPSTPDGTWNVASGRSISVRELADAVEAATRRPLRRASGPRRDGDVVTSAVSAARLTRLGWSPKVTLLEGIAALLKGSSPGPDGDR